MQRLHRARVSEIMSTLTRSAAHFDKSSEAWLRIPGTDGAIPKTNPKSKRRAFEAKKCLLLSEKAADPEGSIRQKRRRR
eukprot:3636314-Amphidinium_carterae.1